MTKKWVFLRTMIIIAAVIAIYQQRAAFTAPLPNEANLVVVMSNRLKIYDLALKGVESVCNAQITTFNLDGKAEVEKLEDTASKIKKQKAKLVLAVGPLATHVRKFLDNVDMVYCMVDEPRRLDLRTKPNIAGIAMDILPEEYVKVAKEIIPDLRYVGFIYNPDFDSEKINELHFLEDRLGFYTVSAEARHDQDILPALETLKGKVDVLWLPNDPLIISENNFAAIIDFANKNKIPTLVSFRSLLAQGAMFSLSSDYTDVGIQAGNMVNEILSGKKKPADFFMQFPNQKNMYINFQTADKIGVKVPLRIAEWEKITKLYESGIEYYNAGSLKLASDAFNKVLELDPEHQGAIFHLQKIDEMTTVKAKQLTLEESRKYVERARSKLSEGISSDNEAAAFTAVELAHKALELDQTSQPARQVITHAREWMMPKIDGYLKEAVRLYSQRSYEQAITILDKILVIAPEHDEAKEYRRLARQKADALKKLEQ